MCLCRELRNWQKRFEVTRVIFNISDSLAAGPVAGFAVDQRQAGVFRDLVAMDGAFKVIVNLVVGVARGQAILVTDVVGLKVADQQSLVITDRLDRFR